MRKEFVVKRIDMSPAGSTFVIISLTSVKDFLEGNKTQSRFDPSKMMNPNNMEDMMKDLNKMLSGKGGVFGGETSLKLEMHEYKEMNLSIGDRVYLELTVDDNSGI